VLEGILTASERYFRKLLVDARKCRSYTELVGVVLDHLGPSTGCHAAGVYLLDDQGRPIDSAAKGVRASFLDRYEELGRGADPVLSAVLDRHRPAHNLDGRSLEAWHEEPVYSHVAAPFGIEHTCTGPILGDGRLIGVVHLARSESEGPFGEDDIRRISLVCHHVSSLLARFSLPGGDAALTPRQAEIADLVAAGMTNAQIALCLSISSNTVKVTLQRIFAKLDVESRAQLVARLRA
jgi:DNA-binding CsgD family transcriptional regulator